MCKELPKGEYWVHETDFVSVDMSDIQYYEKALREKELGCPVCLDEKPFGDDTNKDMSFIIRDGVLFVLRDAYNGSIGPMCVTEAAFKINRCPMCGRKLEEETK